ncbi:unnamed protein product, partial [Tenebrio molitor]
MKNVILVFPCGREVTLFRTHFSDHGPWRHLLVCLLNLTQVFYL